MIVVTGAAGFIGSCLVSRLNQEGHKDIVAVDDFSNHAKQHNLLSKSLLSQIERDAFPEWAQKHQEDIQIIFHFGARTDTLETSNSIFDKLNLRYSKDIWKLCVSGRIPLVYASSAATFGDGQYGYQVDRSTTIQLKPLNAYAKSKHHFDLWVLDQHEAPPGWAGLKFFNVYGPNEYHKGKMSSMIYQAYQQVKDQGCVKLFKSYREDYPDGGQARDFIYVMDIMKLCVTLMQDQPNQLINVGSGHAETFNHLVKAVFEALQQTPKIDYIEMPAQLRDKYQYHTEADLRDFERLKINYETTGLMTGVRDYVENYLERGAYY